MRFVSFFTSGIFLHHINLPLHCILASRCKENGGRLLSSYKLAFALHCIALHHINLPLHCILASRCKSNFLLFACFGHVVINHQKGGACKENGP
jgi:hypothetical protein